MSNEIYTKAMVGLSGLVEVIMALEKELQETQQACQELERRAERLGERIQTLEETSGHGSEADLESLIDDRVESALDMRLDDAIESALSGREIEVTLSGSATL